MPPEYLTTGEFQRWAQSWDKKLDQHMESHSDIAKLVTEHEIKLQVMEKAHGRAKGINGVISAIVAGAISAIGTVLQAKG